MSNVTHQPKIGFVSLGCPKNLVDSERILTELRTEGYDVVPTYDNADMVIVNTCGFIDSAVQESLEAIGEALKENGKVIVTGCLGAKEDQIREAQTVIDAGVDAYVFISNQFAKENESEDVAKKNIEYLLDHIDGDMFGVYECPAPYKRLLSPELLKWCAETEKFAFLKDTCCDLDQLEAKCKAVEGTGLKIFNANAATLLRSMEMGCAGYSGVMANFHPDLYVWLCKNYKEQPEKAQELMNFLGAASMVECQVYPVNSKYHMNLVGVPMTLQSRRQDYKLLTGSKKLEIEEFCAITETFRKSFFGK